MSEVLIPRIIHRVWTGTSVPKKVRDNWAVWEELFPRMEHKYWTDETVTALQAHQALAQLPVFKDPRIKSDYVRLAALLEFGGLYVDSDAELIRPSVLDVFCAKPWIAGHRTKDYKGGPRILNGAICAPPQHPFLRKVFATSILNARSGLTDAHKLAGPHLYMEMYDSSIEIKQVFDILYEAAARKRNLAYLRLASPLAPFVFLGE